MPPIAPKALAVELVATVENLHEVVAMLRPDLCLLPRRRVDAALSLLVAARNPLGTVGDD